MLFVENSKEENDIFEKVKSIFDGNAKKEGHHHGSDLL